MSLEKVNLLHYFEVIAGRDDVTNPKPHPDHLSYICQKLGINTSEIIVIGDTHRDIEGALNVGAPSIAINTKISNLTKGEAFNKANFIIEQHEIPSRLLGVIKQFL